MARRGAGKRARRRRCRSRCVMRRIYSGRSVTSAVSILERASKAAMPQRSPAPAASGRIHAAAGARSQRSISRPVLGFAQEFAATSWLAWQAWACEIPDRKLFLSIVWARFGKGRRACSDDDFHHHSRLSITVRQCGGINHRKIVHSEDASDKHSGPSLGLLAPVSMISGAALPLWMRRIARLRSIFPSDLPIILPIRKLIRRYDAFIAVDRWPDGGRAPTGLALGPLSASVAIERGEFA